MPFPTDGLAGIAWALIPTIVLGLIFWFSVRAILRSDRTERAVQAQIEAEERAKVGLPPRSGVGAPPKE